MSNLEGFWSYVHKDDLAEEGRITKLARDIGSQFELLTGEPLTLFLDQDALKWGENWKEQIDSSLGSVAFFIPVLTPRYFMSPECRRELQFFARRATSLGLKELILPLLYVDIPKLHEQQSSDELIQLVQTFQWEDWRKLRFLEPAAERYRSGVASLAQRLVEVNRKFEVLDSPTATMSDVAQSAADQSPGFLDSLAESEEALPKFTVIVAEIGEQIKAIGEIMSRATREIDENDKRGGSFGARLLIARKTAHELIAPVDKVHLLSNSFASEFHSVDEGIRIIIEHAPKELEVKPENKHVVCNFFNTVRDLSASINKGLAHIEKMIDSIAPLERMTRELRPVLRKLKEGLTMTLEARTVAVEWISLLEQANLNCTDALDERV